MPIEIETLRAGDGEARYRLIRQAFGGTVDPDPDAPDVPNGQALGAYDGDTLVGSTVLFDFAMALGGRMVPCGGISGVVVAPEARGQQLARRLNIEAMRRLDERGTPIAALYPTTATLYRSVGYEVAGWWRERIIPVEHLPAPDRRYRWEKTSIDDPRFWALPESARYRPDGDLRFDPIMERWNIFNIRKAKTENRYVYLGFRDGEPAVALLYKYVDTTAPDAFFGIEIESLRAVSTEGIGAGLAFVGSNGTVAGDIRFVAQEEILAATVPLANKSRIVHDYPFMVRIVDVAGAMAHRAVPAVCDGVVDFTVTDDILEGNAGPARLTIRDGAAAWENSAGDGTVAVTVQDLAAIYCGANPRLLRDLGRLDGATDRDCDILAAAFVADIEMTRFF